jgi:hypothetical protein
MYTFLRMGVNDFKNRMKVYDYCNYFFTRMRPLHCGRGDFTMYVNYYNLGYVAFGKYSNLHIPYNLQHYVSSVISSVVEISHRVKINCLDLSTLVEVTWAFTATLKYTITLQSKVIAKLTVGFRPYRPNENARLRYILSVLI